MLVWLQLVKNFKELLRWLLMLAGVVGTVYGATHGASWWLTVMAGAAALGFLLSALGLGPEETATKDGQRVKYTLDVYFPPALILAAVTVSLYLWA